MKSKLSRTSLIFREIRNYFFVQKAIRKASKTKQWEDLKLRYTLTGRIYTVRSVTQEDMGEEVSVRRYKAMQMMYPINDYISSLGLQEVVTAGIENITDEEGIETRSFLIQYIPLFNNLTVIWIVSRLALIIAGIVALCYSKQIIELIF